MNGDEKQEAQRPRPLSGGIWTLFSWLRRSERSSSSDSLSSVGSARTAASFDFLAPGNCNFTDSPIVLPLHPPSETYKKRLQDRNLRRQRDRDITLHRKYGLFREYGSGYDGFSLPPARRVLESPVNRQNRDRRATSECLQRRAAYVPGKRRAPLPPALTTSATLPRSYKRKRPAPKPPVKSTTKDNLDQQINNTRMNSNLSPVEKTEIIPDNSKTEKCDKKVTNIKDTKLKTDKSFLKHIFENKKRNSAIETSTLRLLPSISELDKQAAEIIENNKLRKNRNNLISNENLGNVQGSSTSYEGNSWFCTSCLRKYNPSIKNCNYCLKENKHQTKNADRNSFRKSFPRSSIHTQTTSNFESASSSQDTTLDERKILKEILKEMKDSLPKKHKDINKANLLTETPTLRIGSTVDEKYKDLTAQPSSSREIHNEKNIKNNEQDKKEASNNRLSISSLLPKTQRNLGSVSNDHATSSTKSSELLNKKINQHNVTLACENKSNMRSTSSKISVDTQSFSSRDQINDKGDDFTEYLPHVVEFDNANLSKQIVIKTESKNGNQREKSITKILQNRDNESDESSIRKILEDNNKHVKKTNVAKNRNNSKSQLSPFAIKENENRETINNLRISNGLKSILDREEENMIDQLYPEIIKKNLTEVNTNEPKKLTHPKMLFLNFPVTNAVLVNSVTVVTSQSNNENSEKPKELFKKTAESQSANLFTSKINEAQSNTTQLRFSSELSANRSENKEAIISQADEQRKIDQIKSHDSSLPSVSSIRPESKLNTPLKISTLLNPFYTPRLPIIKEDKTGPGDEDHEKQLSSNLKVIKSKEIIKEENKKIVEKVTCRPSIASTPELKAINLQNTDVEPFHQKKVMKTEPTNKQETSKVVSNEPLPSTSRCTNGIINNSDKNEDKLDHYDRRRYLVNQLEQSIAKGDEAAAAEAAVKLAKLKLSCSVLSFSSQIIGKSSKQNERVSENVLLKQENEIKIQAEKESIQSTPHTSKETQKQADVDAVNLKSDETVNKFKENNEFSKKEITKLNVPNDTNKKNPTTKPTKENVPSSSTQGVADELVPIDVWVEDKQAERGPIRLRISRRATMADLRRQAEQSLGLATQLQRWIIGRTLCNDDETTIISLAGPELKAPFYLCLVQSETNDKPITEVNAEVKENDDKTEQNGEFYTELMKLEKQSLVPNMEAFECGVCMEECAAGAGVVLRECIHSFCRTCLSDVVQHCQEPVVSCPATGCSGNLQEREIRTIVSPEEYERWLARSLATAECGTRNAFHCRTRDCTGWAFCDPGVRRFPCPVCNHTNCVQCQAIHEGETCEQYQVKLRAAVAAAETNKDDEGTQSLINSLIARGEALECPECKAIITKKWGCDWVKCSACKTEICWITKGRRWGPGGRGDTSGGCRCGVDGQRCHPSCGYCH